MSHFLFGRCNKIAIEEGIHDILLAMAKTKYNVDLIHHMLKMDQMERYKIENAAKMGHANYLNKYYPYDEFKEFALQFK